MPKGGDDIADPAALRVVEQLAAERLRDDVGIENLRVCADEPAVHEVTCGRLRLKIYAPPPKKRSILHETFEARKRPACLLRECVIWQRLRIAKLRSILRVHGC